MGFRKEKDTLGWKEVPEGAYYGVQTVRALENFPISGTRQHPVFIRAYVFIKKAAAEVNSSLGLLDRKLADAIVQACDEILSGRFMDQFVVDVYQAGAGTSQNMNVNEVIANRAIEILDGNRGDYSLVHPNDHVNMAQSTNDTFPTAMRMAILLSLPELIEAVKGAMGSFSKLAKETEDVLTSGRTHLQDATPISLGQEFRAFEETLRKALIRMEGSAEMLREMNIGGSAVGTGVNVHPRYPDLMAERLGRLTGLRLTRGKNLVELSQSTADFAHFSSSLKLLAADLTKISNDLRLMSSGPTTGLAEITLPAVQPGSSIMPGKVNPVICEALNMICYQVMGNDHTVSMASQAGQFQLNVMMPVIIYNILTSMNILSSGLKVFRERCVEGITANRERCGEYSARSLGLAALLNPLIGYSRAAEVVKDSLASGKTILEVLREKKIISEEEIERLLSPYSADSDGGKRR